MTEDNPFQSPQANLANAEQNHDQIHLFGFQGRMGRLRYLSYTFVSTIIACIGLALLVGTIAAIAVPNLPEGQDSAITLIFFGLSYFVVFASIFAIQAQYGVRRLHDLNRSGWLWLLALIPLLNLFFLLFLLFAPGSDSNNKYGSPPPPNTAGVWVGAILPVLVVPVIGLMVALAINESNEYRMRLYGKVAVVDFSNLLKNLRANSGSPDEIRTYLAGVQKSNAPPNSLLQLQTTGDNVLVSLKNPKHWANVSFTLSFQQENGEIQWKCIMQGSSSRENDWQFNRLLQRCKEFQ